VYRYATGAAAEGVLHVFGDNLPPSLPVAACLFGASGGASSSAGTPARGAAAAAGGGARGSAALSCRPPGRAGALLAHVIIVRQNIFQINDSMTASMVLVTYLI
jgi:hypothetical protein